ncbi:phosphopantetheine-binding protein [Kitasatospora kifunensis]|uniref:Acyl carrier protein n=1 Tax=Kitasatospora kifunensis TaxID=58351 RepID=A0A7W7VXW2_KITKI|nr:phosphopantetheine-binding protein [Kitasatospora kifunensis]MBB4926926.1 acyl carrier protein [Kitasatospora kifunensis]
MTIDPQGDTGDGVVPSAAQLAARSSSFRIITDRWCAILQESEEYEDYTFFELGGTSVAASHLVLQLWMEFGFRVPLSALFENPTLRQFRDHMASTLAEEEIRGG